MRYEFKAYFNRRGLAHMLNYFMNTCVQASIHVRKFDGHRVHNDSVRFEADIETESQEFYQMIQSECLSMDETTMNLCRRLI